MDAMMAGETSAPDAQPSTAALIDWTDGAVTVSVGDKLETVDDIGAALQIVLDAYKATENQGQPGQADFLAGFGEQAQPMRNPNPADRASAGRF